MKEPSTWIKLDRNILGWRWYTDANTFRVFVHLLLNANIADHDFRDETIHRGELATSMGHIAESLGITYKNVRTALMHLVSTQEVAIKRRPKYIVISILNYDKYQSSGNQRAGKGQSKGNQRATIKEGKKERSKESLSLSPSHKPYHIPSIDEVEEYERTSGLGKDPVLFYRHYESANWMAKGNPIYDWVSLYQKFEPPQQTRLRSVSERPSRFTDADGITYELVDGQYEKVRA